MIYEYRYYVDMYCDISQMRITEETYRDMKTISQVSFNGCMSDQTHRMFMPTSLPLTTMGKTLFDGSVDFEKLKSDYFLGAFGDDGAKVREYLNKLSVLLSPSNFRVGGKRNIEEEGISFIDTSERPWINNPYVADRAEKIPDCIDAFLPVIERNIIGAEEPVRRDSWVYLKIHAEICRYHGRILLAGAKGDMNLAREIFSELRDYLSEWELSYHKVFDLWLYTRAWAMKISAPLPGYYD